MAGKRVLVVDDSCMYQRILTDLLDDHPQIDVVGVASNGKIALDMVDSLQPDLITLDVLMPEMDGIKTLLQLCKRWPDIRTIMISSLTNKAADAAFDALALGANDYVAKPLTGSGVGNVRDRLAEDLIPKIEALCGIELQPVIETLIQPELVAQAARNNGVKSAGSQHGPEIVVIGVSTGGPDALAKILPELPADMDVPVCIVQHMPPEFTRKLADRLDSACTVNVREAQLGDVLRAGTVYIAPGDYHMVLEHSGSDVIINLNQNPAENSCRPSVDPLFRSAAAVYGSKCLGVVLTGMGQDGLKGSEKLFTAGGSVLVQDEKSSIVWGMPKLVALAGLSDQQVSLSNMANVIVQRVRSKVVAAGGRLHEDAAIAAYSRQKTAKGRGT